MLDQRGIGMRASDRDFILNCTALDVLDTWSDRMLEVSVISELFDV